MKVRIGFFVLLAIVIGCDQQTIAPAARLRGPLDTVVAGTRSQVMFVAGGVFNALYAMDLEQGQYANATIGAFVRAPNKFFPLEIPVGRNPTALATTGDGLLDDLGAPLPGEFRSGEIVLALSGADNHVYAVDADTQFLVRDPDNRPLRIEVGRGGSSITRAPNVSGFQRFWIASPLDQAAHAVDLYKDASSGQISLAKGPVISNTGSMTRLAMSPDGIFLFGADPSSPFVHRVNTLTGEVAHFDVGGPSLDVALVGGDARLYVARPDTLSVEVFNALTGVRIDQNARFAPPLLDDQPFTGIYLGDVPARLRAVELPDVGLETTCIPVDPATGGSGDPIVKTPRAFLMAASDSGRVFFINTTGSAHQDADSDDVLFNTSFCFPPQVKPDPTTPDLFSDIAPFVPCADDPDLPRLVCDEASGVQMLFGYVPSATAFTMQYEAVVPGASRVNGGGTLNEDGTGIFDIGTDLNALDIQANDRLILLSGPGPTDDCGEVYGGDTEFSKREFTIVTREDTDTGPILRLDPPVRPDCFSAAPGALSYLVRAANAFVFSRSVQTQATEYLGRMRPGDTFGGSGDPVRFQLRPDLMVGRDTLVNFGVISQFSAVIGGRVPLSNGVSSDFVPAGRLPTSITVTRIGQPDSSNNRTFVALVSFAASDSIVVLDPTSSSRMEAGSTPPVVLR